jgi:hypothetical protein
MVIRFVTRVATCAIRQAGVIEIDVPPVVGVVAVRTLTAKMVLRFIT